MLWFYQGNEYVGATFSGEMPEWFADSISGFDIVVREVGVLTLDEEYCVHRPTNRPLRPINRTFSSWQDAIQYGDGAIRDYDGGWEAAVFTEEE